MYNSHYNAASHHRQPRSPRTHKTSASLSGSLSRASLQHGGSLSRLSAASLSHATSLASLHDTSSIVLFPVANEPHTPRTLARSSAALAARGGVINADMAISNFHIVYDKGVAKYKPGEEMKGKVVMDVWSTIEILYVEFKIQGYGTIRQFRESGGSGAGFAGKPVHEYYINKRILLLSPPNGTNTMVLKPGKYVSEFSYTLPEVLPPTVAQFDLGQGFVFDISYVCKANVCDLMRTRHMGNMPQVARVVKATKATFAMACVTTQTGDDPITHSEQVQLFCSPFNSEPSSMLVQLNKGTYPVGEYIKVGIEVISPDKKRVKKLSTELEQTIIVRTDKKRSTKIHQTLIKAVDSGKNRQLIPRSKEMIHSGGNMDMIKTGFRLPIPINFVPSQLPNCRIVEINYFIKVSVSFRRLGGTLQVRIPIAVQPMGEEIEKQNGQLNIPLFNKPIMQFPYFARNHNQESMRSSDSQDRGSQTSMDTFFNTKNSNKRDRDHRDRHTAKHERVTTQYKTCITCCGCCLLCLGYGIYD